MVSIRDVAAKAGVSHQTVSNYINSPSIVAEKTRVRIKQAIEELGYRPNAVARRLKTGRSDLIAIGVAASEQRKQSLIFDEFLHMISSIIFIAFLVILLPSGKMVSEVNKLSNSLFPIN